MPHIYYFYLILIENVMVQKFFSYGFSDYKSFSIHFITLSRIKQEKNAILNCIFFSVFNSYIFSEIDFQGVDVKETAKPKCVLVSWRAESAILIYAKSKNIFLKSYIIINHN